MTEYAMGDNDGTVVVTILGNETWHDGPGWYYYEQDYPGEGSCGAFATEAKALAHAQGAVKS